MLREVYRQRKPRLVPEMPLIQPRPLSRLLIRRQFTCLTCRRTSWSPSPSPPRLPKEEQEIFEQLQRQSTGAFSNSSESTRPDSSSLHTRIHQSLQSEGVSSSTAKINQSPQSDEKYRIEAEGEGEELHPHIRRGAPPEFEGDTNPKTGEVGGPKNEPLRWGATGDWSYNGRVTDF
jgi:hypothetical protein